MRVLYIKMESEQDTTSTSWESKGFRVQLETVSMPRNKRI